MSKRNDSISGVDFNSKALGVKHLRVAESSAPPFLLLGQPRGSVYILAEMIADQILSIFDVPD